MDPLAPQPVAGLPEEQQAKVLLEDYTGAMAWGSELKKGRDALIKWIERLYDEQQARTSR